MVTKSNKVKAYFVFYTCIGPKGTRDLRKSESYGRNGKEAIRNAKRWLAPLKPKNFSAKLIR